VPRFSLRRAQARWRSPDALLGVERVDVHITLGGRGDLAAQIYRQLLDAILDGRLRVGERLPPTRVLAGQLAVSRNTVSIAYERLGAEGYLSGRVGAGTYISAPTAVVRRARPRPARSAAPDPERPAAGVRPRRQWASLPLAGTAPAVTPQFDFSVGVPDRALFPFETWRRLIGRELRPTAIGSVDYADPAGHAGLRAAIARHYGVSRAVHASGDDVLVTHGAQQALDLIGRVLIEPGSCVAVEEPGYPPVRHLFQSLGARVVGVPVDASGLVVDALPRGARLVYVTPSHQFPLGSAMSLARRTALLSWAHDHGAIIIEDDYDSEFRFSERPLEPLQSIDQSGRVIYVGTFSKTLLPVLRLGFLIAPPSLLPALRTAKQLTDWHVDVISQATLAHFIDEGLLARHIRRAARQYAARHHLVVGWLRDEMADLLDLVPSTAGLHVCARLAAGAAVDVETAVRRAASVGVSVRSLAAYYAEAPGSQGLVLGYGAIPADRIAAGIAHLTAALRHSSSA
jgi:GntR family transcriptional regulator / MocR family aminotransferase